MDARLTTGLSAILKVPGGKRWLVPLLSEYWAPYKEMRLVEPFSGALNVALGLMPRRVLANDANPHYQNFHRHIADGKWHAPDIQKLFLGANNREAYDSRRERFNVLVGVNGAQTWVGAQLCYYLNRHCYNGLWRENAHKRFNTPFGSYKSVGFVEDVSQYRNAFEGWQFTTGDFADVKTTADDWTYSDPPYDCDFVTYTGDGFSWGDQVRLASWLAKRPGPVVASNAATPRILALYQDLGFLTHVIEAPRRISCKGAERKPVMEMLALSGHLA